MIIDHRYEVLESLGSGTWSNVYKVLDKRTNKLYALKLFQFLSSSDLYDKFSAEEMHHITKIDHPNLSHVVDFGHVGDHIYCLSDYYDGVSLNNFRFKKSQLNVLYDIIVQIAYALDALHDQDIIHKDLKPENVLYKIENTRVNVKVIDYGFAKIDLNKDNQNVAGTLPYIAPEIFLSKLHTKACDYFSLGVLLYKITTGSYPFSIEQINALITSSNQYFIPKFPSDLNKDIPQSLEKFILRLLERNPDNRFNSAEDVINYLNRIQTTQYPYSIEWSLVNKLKFNSYISREKYSHQIIDYINSVIEKNGKIISIIGGDGLGKENVVSLFRYHILNGSYYLFDYSCSKQDHEPFFALIKEFMQSLTKEELVKYDNLANISEKFKMYLFQSTKDAKKVTQNQEELKADFDSVKRIILSLSEQKPIIFIIRNSQYMHRYSVDFINYISPYIASNKVMIVLGYNDYNKLIKIAHSIIIQILPLTYNETADYIIKLLNEDVSPNFISKIWELSAGNPYFVREILIDLVNKKKIVRGKKLFYDYDFSDYSLPFRLIQSIYSRLSFISSKNYRFLQLLAIAESPLNRELITYILNIRDKELYDFINDSVYNEILQKKNQNYQFIYKEAQNKLKSETTQDTHIAISKVIIESYKVTRIMDVETCKGIIKNTIVAGDLMSQREFTKILYNIYEEQNNQDEAYNAILDVLYIDFNPSIQLSDKELILDLRKFQEKTELTGLSNCSNNLISKIKKLHDSFEKYYLLCSIYYIREDIEVAKKFLDQAVKYIVTGKQRILVWLYYCHIYSSKDVSKMHLYLTELSKEKLPLDLKIAYRDRILILHKNKGELFIAIKITEEFLDELPPVQDTNVLIRLGSLHNNLGVCYSLLKNIEEADEHFNIALSIWNKFNIKRYLGLIYNNIADLYLKQGITPDSELYSQKGYEIASKQGLKSTVALALLNMGEAYIKMGEFHKAEEYLHNAKSIIEELKSKKHLDIIQMNLALAKSKINNFSYYFDFIKQNEPQLIELNIREINPLIKTYFYYLFELGLIKKLTKLIRKNAHINYHEIREDEFYYNTLSMIAILNNNYLQALEHLKNAAKHAGEVRNHYAITVFYLSEIECCIGLKDYSRAEEIISKAITLAYNYKYRYWLIKLKYFSQIIDLANSSIPLRKILRSLKDIYSEVEECDYFILKAKIMLLTIQVLKVMSAEDEALLMFKQYRDYLDSITNYIDESDKQSYLKLNYYYSNSLEEIDIRHITLRSRNTKDNWNELQYNILNINNTERIKFLIEKGINDIIAPWKFQLMIYTEQLNSYSVYLGDTSNGDYSLTPEIFQLIEKAYKTDSIVIEYFDNSHNMIIPLQIKYHTIGFMIISDNNELNFTKLEISMMKAIKQHIANLIIRIRDYSEITERMLMMNKLMLVTHALLKLTDISSLEHEIVSACIDFTGSTRGFLIKKDIDGNYIYQVAMDTKKAILSNISVISKTVLSECQFSKTPIFSYNAQEDNRFKNSISVQDYKLHSIYCAPLIVNDEIYGLVYLDNFLDNSKKIYMNPEIMTLLLDQVCIALKNALQYESIIHKSLELQSLESIKDEFMAIVSHELNTPLTTLQGYISRLKRNLYADDEEKQDILNKIETNVKKLILTTNDIVTMNNYNLKTELPKVKIQIADIINLIYHEIEIVSRHRKMFIKIEVSSDLPEVEGNWEALHLMIYNIVLNAIRFTNDFGTIVLGARKSAFQQEKINNKDTLVIYIQDNGIGIPEYQIKNVFRKFYELNEIYAHKSGTIEYRSSGLGLGLAIAKRIAELHSGIVWIKSKENEGTTVFISLPVKQEKRKRKEDKR